ncbi:ROK family protein [Oceanibaculum indicum]|uniref:ROK family protein n=1 Tax=Oceanibaculum indicum P24 TaxID=1207063 RepID=K2KFG9_9PROT|nr:ROK family protein [Oceanibaculum indicum]EKE76100.1 ROK family protein [Oceanibaculum indicum P24]
MRIGIDLGGTKIEIAALDEADGAVLARERIATPRGDYDATIAAIRDLVAGMEARLGRGGTVGIGVPGAISPASGLVKNANSTWLIGRPFDRDLEVALGRPVRLANDANCFALSEAVDGSAAGAAIMFGVILGTGVGGGIVVNGRVLTGANAISGEWGHNPLPWPEDTERPGPACYCGRHGCIETFLSGPGLAADHQRATGTAMSAEDVVAAAAGGDAAAEATMRRYEDRLARALAHLVNILDPEVIVLGGGLSGLPRLYEAVPRLWGRYIFSDHVATRLLSPVHGDAGGVRGAAWLWPPERNDRR